MTASSLAPTAARSGTAAYKRSVLRRSALLATLLIATLAAVLADLVVGSGTLSLHDVVVALFDPAAVSRTVRVVVWDIRAPMTVAAALVGIELAVAGTLMQTVTNNPLAEPFTLGISSAAGFGAALAIVFGSSAFALVPWMPPELFVAGNAFLFSLLTVALVTLLAGRSGFGVETVTLLGIAIHFVFNALLAFAQYVADPNQLQSLVFWLLGSLLRATWTKVLIDAVVVGALFPFLLLGAWALTAMRGFGDGAVVLGVRVGRLRVLAMVAAALLAGAATATVGIVGFVGLVAPHMARFLVGEDQRFSLPVTACCGALVLTLASLASKVVLPGVVLPIGMLTALLGVPVFLVQILRRRRAGR